MIRILTLISCSFFLFNCYSHTQNFGRHPTSNLPTATYKQKYNPILTVSLREEKTETATSIPISLEEIKKNVKETELTVISHPAYNGKTITYLGFEFNSLLYFLKQKLGVTDISQFTYSFWASDNFSSFIEPQDLHLGTAFFAWREKVRPVDSLSSDGLWTNVEKHGNPGPFYLVWNTSKNTYWQKWPFKIIEVTFVSKKIMNAFINVTPNDEFELIKGYRLTLKNCVSCHKIANFGYGEMGPDLKDIADIRSENDFLKQIRSPLGKMIPFNTNELSDSDIKSIHKYLLSLTGKK